MESATCWLVYPLATAASTCTQGWQMCEEFQLGLRSPVPAPILPDPILKGISARGYYVWRGWSGGQNKRPAK